MRPVVQLERTGCGIAGVAALAGLSYARAKAIAGSLGIHAQDERLWSETAHVRRLLAQVGYKAGRGEVPFRSWDSLPDLALLSIKWHRERGRPFWHWVVFVREDGGAYVLDSKEGLATYRRTDFGRMKPKWYIPVARRDGPRGTSKKRDSSAARAAKRKRKAETVESAEKGDSAAKAAKSAKEKSNARIDFKSGAKQREQRRDCRPGQIRIRGRAVAQGSRPDL